MPPVSDIFELQSIPDAGRGLIATSVITQDSSLLICADPAVHVVFREYRKEVCAWCFHYDRGRSLPIRNNDIGKVYCSEACQLKWCNHNGELEVKAWQCLEAFLKSNGKNVRVLTTDVFAGSKPTPEVISASWDQCDGAIRHYSHEAINSAKTKKHKTNFSEAVYPDVLSSELSAILLHHFHADTWESDIKALVADEMPYKTLTELEITCNSVLQLSRILPAELLASCSSLVSFTATAAGSHNAFGIRAGGEDNEEYMAWAIYPNASYFNHSCDPNVSKQRTGREWHFRAARQIEEGEQLCISYLGGDEKDLDLKQRRERLNSVWGFICACHRCQAEEASAGQIASPLHTVNDHETTTAGS